MKGRNTTKAAEVLPGGNRKETKMTTSRELEILKRFGAENTKGYCLVNNYGYTFDFRGVHYDARFWANMYGVALNEWQVSPRFPDLERALNSAEG